MPTKRYAFMAQLKEQNSPSSGFAAVIRGADKDLIPSRGSSNTNGSMK
jgi:hypothetical protein